MNSSKSAGSIANEAPPGWGAAGGHSMNTKLDILLGCKTKPAQIK